MLTALGIIIIMIMIMIIFIVIVQLKARLFQSVHRVCKSSVSPKDTSNSPEAASSAKKAFNWPDV